MDWKDSGRVALWQFGVTVLVGVLCYLISQYLHHDMPSSMSGLAMLLGAQAFALSREAKVPGNLEGRIWRLTWKTSLITTVVGVFLAIGYFKVAASELPEIEELMHHMETQPIFDVIVLVVAAVMALAMTSLGLKMGTRLARKNALRKVS